MSGALRTVALGVLQAAYSRRLECERRVWEARDEAAGLRRKLIDAEAREATEQRVLDDAHEFTRMIWEDLRPAFSDADRAPTMAVSAVLPEVRDRLASDIPVAKISRVPPTEPK